jgi:hypothetical protein
LLKPKRQKAHNRLIEQHMLIGNYLRIHNSKEIKSYVIQFM